jgi:hypothetical protein
MTTHVPGTPTNLPTTHLMTAVQIPPDFTINEVAFNPEVAAPKVADNAPALGPLEAFKGTFLGHGFNTIFRPQNSSTATDLPVPQPSDNILELNLTVESLSFSNSLGAVPNRGEVQGDIFVNGVSYLQSISDVTDPANPTPIHLEPGLWVMVPPATGPSETGSTVARMASIPHGTTINAPGTFLTVAGGPQINKVDITPFPIGNPGGRIPVPSQQVVASGTPRIPRDLSVAPAITQDLVDDPNTLLRNHIAGMTILSTNVLLIDTRQSAIPGAGTDISDGAGPDANAIEMSAIFWVETVEAEIQVDQLDAGYSLDVSPVVPVGAPAPTFTVTSAAGTHCPQSVTVNYPQDPTHPKRVAELRQAHLAPRLGGYASTRRSDRIELALP